MASYQALRSAAARGTNQAKSSLTTLVESNCYICRPCCRSLSSSITRNSTSTIDATNIPAAAASCGDASSWSQDASSLLAEIGQRELSRKQQRSSTSDFVRSFSTKVAAADAAQSDDEISTNVDAGILEQESDPQRLLEELGMKEEDLYKIASQTPTSLKLGDMYKYANIQDKNQRLRNAQFLHRELPIRVGQRAVDLLTLPYGLSEATPIRQVACAYIRYCHRMLSFPCPETFEEEEAFTDLLQSLVLDRTSIPMSIARGLAHWREENKRQELEEGRLQEMEDALYRFFTARCGLRFLTEHHVLSCHRESTKDLRRVTWMFPEKESQDEFSGCIHSGLDLVNEISQVADLVVQQTKDFYGFSPEVELVDCMDRKETGEFTYVPHHLHYMMGELIKNSCRATVRDYLSKQAAAGNPVNTNTSNDTPLGSLSRAASATTNNSPKLPPIRVVIVKGDEDVTIKVADKGGGIPRSRMAKIWKFAHSTADEEESSSAFGTDGLSGLKIRGFGLPLCRIYARYLGGDLTLKSMEGYGLDAYLHLPRLGVACENLPNLVRHSPGERDSTPNRNIRNFSTALLNAAIAAESENRGVNNRNGDVASILGNHLVQGVSSKSQQQPQPHQQ